MVAFLATSVFASCSDDDDPVVTTAVTLNPESVTFTAAGGSQTVQANGNAKVKSATSDAAWLTVEAGAYSPTNLRTVLTLTAEKNTSSQQRTANVTIAAGTLTLTLPVTQAAGDGSGDDKPGTITTKAMDIAKDMYPGWNLGNTLEGTGGETAWQPTTTTKAIIDYVKAQGFKSVRIPCSWMVHSTDGQVDATWTNRVKEIVNYCIDDGLYVVINDHWDGGWLEERGYSKTSSTYEKVDEATITAKIDTLKNLWTQIANTFKDYGDHLLFAGQNEPFQNYNLFNSHHAELTPILERYNQAFVDAVRATGGNNTLRTLVVQGPSTNIASSTDAAINFTMPTDQTGGTGRLMLEVHYYDPWNFSGQTDNGAAWFWGAANHVAGSTHNASYGEESYMASQMLSLNTKFVKNGYPVIIGECGVQWRQLSENQTEHDASVKLWYSTLFQDAVSNRCVPMVWDINSTNRQGTQGTMTIIDRANLSVFCTPAMEGITAGVAAATWPN